MSITLLPASTSASKVGQSQVQSTSTISASQSSSSASEAMSELFSQFKDWFKGFCQSNERWLASVQIIFAALKLTKVENDTDQVFTTINEMRMVIASEITKIDAEIANLSTQQGQEILEKMQSIMPHNDYAGKIGEAQQILIHIDESAAYFKNQKQSHSGGIDAVVLANIVTEMERSKMKLGHAIASVDEDKGTNISSDANFSRQQNSYDSSALEPKRQIEPRSLQQEISVYG